MGTCEPHEYKDSISIGCGICGCFRSDPVHASINDHECRNCRVYINLNANYCYNCGEEQIKIESVQEAITKYNEFAPKDALKLIKLILNRCKDADNL